MVTDVCQDTRFIAIIRLLLAFLQVLQIIVPIGLIIMGSIDLGRAVMANRDDDIKKAQRSFIRRCLAAVMVFLVALIVNFVMNFIGESRWKDCWKVSVVNGDNIINYRI